MKKALLKDSVKEIKNTYKRFISILLMAFLGVGFFAGIRATSPDMTDTLDKYYDNQNVYDIQVLSTLGLTDEDIEELSKVEGVEQVTGSFEKDGKIDIDNKEIVTKFLVIDDVNKPLLLEGNLPQAENECLVESSFLKATNKHIGDTIQVEIEDASNDDGEKISYLKQNEIKIVGTTQSPLYVSRDRGTSKLGAGKVNYYIYIQKDNINATDTYTNVYLTVKNAKQYVTSSDKYEDYIEAVKDNIEQIKEEREQARREKLVDNANKKVLDAENELNTKKEEANQQIEEAETKLQDGRNKIQSGENEINSNKQKADKEFTQASKQIEDAEKQLVESKEKIQEIENPTWYILDRNANAGYVGFIQDTKSIENIGKVFPVVFFIVATLISLTSMTRMVEEQRMQIGTLKALRL